MAESVTKQTFPVVQTLISEFRMHLGKYWRSTVETNSIVIMRKSFEEQRGAVFMSKELFDRLLAKAAGVTYKTPVHEKTHKIERVIYGPELSNKMLRKILYIR